jgi:hypothetical protein
MVQVRMSRHSKPGVTAFTTVAVLLVMSLAARSDVSAGQRPTDAGRELAVISSLNDCIQSRFGDVDERFGFRRIITPGQTPHRFTPENAKELDAVRALQQSGLQVVLYLTGRQILRDKAPADLLTDDVAWRFIKGPVVISTADGTAGTAPKPMDLRDESARAMRSFENRDSYDFIHAGWNFTARPVRASDDLCLRCHRGSSRASLAPSPAGTSVLKIGDAIGAVLYGYKKP